jgi:peptidoglycan/xylan/chitin deacetylase (PgdA/CDA1 family)
MPINLLYHDVTPAGADEASGFAAPEAARYKLTPDEFTRHLDRIGSTINHAPVVTTSPHELRRANGSTWLLTFDDGGLSAATVIADELERRGWRGWFFIATDFIGTPAFCDRDQIRDLQRRGHVIGSHSCSHPERLCDGSYEQICDEWRRSRDVLSAIVSAPITTASVPGGFYSTRVARAAAACGLRLLFNSEPTTGAFVVDGCLILGRYNVYRGMPATDAAALLSSPLRRWRQFAFWNLKKTAKTCAAPLYKTIRQRVLNRVYTARATEPLRS